MKVPATPSTVGAVPHTECHPWVLIHSERWRAPITFSKYRAPGNRCLGAVPLRARCIGIPDLADRAG